MGDGPLVLNFSSEQDNPYLADVVLKERFDLADRTPVSKGFWIEREIYALDDDQFAQPLDTLKAGESYVTRIRIASNTAHRQVLITDPLISGVESVDEHLDNTRKIYHLQDDVCI